MSDTTQIDILLVEDSPTDAELCLFALKGMGLANKLTLARDGAEALSLLLPAANSTDNRIEPKLILLDLGLPKVTGLELLRKLKSDERTRKLPIVVLTSSKESRDINEAYSLGVNSFVSKPIDFEEFLKVTRKLGFYWLLVNRTN
jgi:two-component system, response regulator